MHVVVTGATGFIGQALVRAMHRRGWRIRALVRHPSGLASQWLASLGVQLVEADVGSPERLVPAMRGIDLLVHAAGVNEIGASPAVRERMREVNLRGTDHVLGAARLAGVRRSLYVSTAWVLGTAAATRPTRPSRTTGGTGAPTNASPAKRMRWRSTGASADCR